MNGKQYMDTSLMLIRIGKEIEKLDLEGFIKCIEVAHESLPKVSDNLRARAETNLNAVRRLAVSYKRLKQDLAETREVVQKTSMAYMVDEKK